MVVEELELINFIKPGLSVSKALGKSLQVQLYLPCIDKFQ